MERFEYILLIVMSFLPPIIYAVWIRNTEKFNRERWGPIFICFLWGATIAVVAAIILEVFLHYSVSVSIQEQSFISLIALILIAPFAEELTKPLVLSFKTVKKELDELEDGLIYGAVAGLGFSATENLLYGYTFLQQSLFYFLVLITIRSFGGCLLHASATAWTGYGYGKAVMKRSRFIRVVPYFILAIVIHAIYNSLLIFDFLGSLIALITALLFAYATLQIVRRKIIRLDRKT
jgi:protease PrsW